MLRRLALTLAGAATVVAASTGGCGGDEAASRDDPVGLVAYDSLQGSYEIYLANADGTGDTRLTHDDVADYDPALSPDGSKIAFVSERHLRGAEVYVVNADDGKRRRLTRPGIPWWQQDPAWSPDGRQIALASSDGIYVINADGTGARRITRGIHAEDPAWSPDGTRLVFAGDTRISVVNADGSGLRPLTSTEMWAESPSWSPDGRTILFDRLLIPRGGSDFGSDAEIWVTDPEGGAQRRLYSGRAPTSQSRPVWSPDGRWIALVAHEYSGYDEPACNWIQIVKVDGSEPRRLTRCATSGAGTGSPHSAVDNPSWSMPDAEAEEP